MSIEEQNKLIASFMEVKPVYILDGGFKYHSSWDWLHPVWNKFRDLYKDKDAPEKYFILKSRVYVRLGEDTPEPAFKELVKAITWYNTQNK